ncbi:hypothetical protein HDU92_000069 [Lobulomyces angularis]|nr:hypothetical protein HDU92_000069 [Lobulomyces angularis]
MENILNLPRTKENSVKSLKETVWDTVFKTNAKAFKSRNNMSYNGMVRTDGVSICVLLSSPKPKQKESLPRVKKRKIPEKSEYFQDNLEDLHFNKVYIDPNKRDLLYCLGGNVKKLRYTQMQRRKESGLKHYRKIRERYEVATEEVVNYELTKKTLDKTKWNDHMEDFLLSFTIV